MVNAYLHAYLFSYLSSHLPICFPNYIPTNICTYIHTFIHTDILSFIYLFIHTYILSFIHLSCCIVDTSLKHFSKELFEAILEFTVKNPTSSLKHFHIVDQSENLVQKMQDNIAELKKLHSKPPAADPPVDGSQQAVCACCHQQVSALTMLNKCKHLLCQNCNFKTQPLCPICQTLNQTIVGNMPRGAMYYTIFNFPLDGYLNCGTIEITYEFDNGIQEVKVSYRFVLICKHSLHLLLLYTYLHLHKITQHNFLPT